MNNKNILTKISRIFIIVVLITFFLTQQFVVFGMAYLSEPIYTDVYASVSDVISKYQNKGLTSDLYDVYEAEGKVRVKFTYRTTQPLEYKNSIAQGLYDMYNYKLIGKNKAGQTVDVNGETFYASPIVYDVEYIDSDPLKVGYEKCNYKVDFEYICYKTYDIKPNQSPSDFLNNLYYPQYYEISGRFYDSLPILTRKLYPRVQIVSSIRRWGIKQKNSTDVGSNKSYSGLTDNDTAFSGLISNWEGNAGESDYSDVEEQYYYEEIKEKYTPRAYNWENDISNQSKKEYIKDLYVNALGRDRNEIGDNEIESHFDSGLINLSEDIIFSDESKNRNNSGNSIEDMDNGEFVDLAYKSVLGRNPDSSKSAYVSDLNEGKLTKRNLIAALVLSNEFKNKRFDAKRAYIIDLYERILERKPSEFEINEKMAQETTYFTDVILKSDEAINKGANYKEMDINNFINFLYGNLLRRAPDDLGRENFIKYFNEGYMTKDDILNNILTSDEFIGLRKSYHKDEEEKDKTDKVINMSDESKKLYLCDLYYKVYEKEISNSELEQLSKKSVQQATIDIILSSTSSFNKDFTNDKIKEQFVKYLYYVILNKTDNDIDNSGLEFHKSCLNSGNVSKRNVIRTFVESDEFRAKKNGEIVTIENNEELCDAIYNNLQSLSINSWRVSNNTLKLYKSDAEGVTTLNISGKNVIHLTGLSNFKNLTTLYAENNRISNVGELEILKELKYINLKNNRVSSNIGIFNGLTNLEELYLDNNCISNPDANNAFNQLTNLRVISLNNNHLKSAPVLNGLTKLQTIGLDDNFIENIDGISSISANKISMKNNCITRSGIEIETEIPQIIKKVSDANSIIYTSNGIQKENCEVNNDKLHLNNRNVKGRIRIVGGIADGTIFEYYNNVSVLAFKDKALADKIEAQFNGVIKSEGVKNGEYVYQMNPQLIMQVKRLNLSTEEGEAQISDLSGIEKFANLGELDISGNNISNYAVIKNLKKLETLKARYCNLTSINPIKDIKGLKQIDISNNNITDINEISNLNNLEDVILSNNNISDISPLGSLNKLNNLAIANNNITSLSSLNGIDLKTLDASNNRIDNLDGINVSKINELQMLENNMTIAVDLDTRKVDIPDIIRLAVNDGNGASNLEFENCSINNNKIVLDDGNIYGRIIINKGRFKDSCISVMLPVDRTPPELRVRYVKNETTGNVEVSIYSNEELKNWTSGFQLTGNNKVLKKTYSYNTNESVRVFDLNGNSVLQEIKVNNARNEKIPGLSLSYSELASTKNNVIVTISADVPLGDPNNGGMDVWHLSDDRKSMTQSFWRYGGETTNVQTEENYLRLKEIEQSIANGASEASYAEEKATLLANQVPVQFLVFNTIEGREPTCYVEYSSEEMGKKSVRATIWSDKDIDLVDNSRIATKITRLDNSGYNEYGLVLYYSKNATEELEVSDSVGNKVKVNISINNIDSSLDGLKLNTNKSISTNQNVSLSVTANEPITGSAKAATFAGTRILNSRNNGIIQARLQNGDYRVAGVGNEIRSAEVDNDNDTDTQDELQDELLYDFDENTQGVMSFYDGVGNIDTTVYNINMIDRESPSIKREKDIINNDGSVTVTLSVSENIQNIDDFAGWEFNEEKTVLTKKFDSNANEILKFVDVAGNEMEYLLNVNSVNKIPYEVFIRYNYAKKKYFVEIVADREIKPVSGWIQSDDKTAIARFMNEDEIENVLIVDNDGDSSEVCVRAKINNNSNGNNGTNTDNPTDDPIDNPTDNPTDNLDNKDVIDTSVADKELPQTGKSSIGVVIVLSIIIIAEYVSVVILKKKMN